MTHLIFHVAQGRTCIHGQTAIRVPQSVKREPFQACPASRPVSNQFSTNVRTLSGC